MDGRLSQYLLGKISVNALIGRLGMLLSPHAHKSLNSIEKIQPRMICAAFNGNPSTTIISCYSSTNAGDETNFNIFYNDLSSLVRSIPKYNTLIVGGDMKAQIAKKRNESILLTQLVKQEWRILNIFLTR